ncbi:MAG: nucleotidyltransferase domain-containing protein [Nitrospiria bacterium]
MIERRRLSWTFDSYFGEAVEKVKIQERSGGDDPVLRDFLREIVPLQKQIQRIILFGSRARGTHLPDSDYDLLLVVDRKDRAFVDKIYDAVMEILLRHGRLISLKCFTSEEMMQLSGLKTPFMQHIQKEGIAVG